jgi:putative Holliday junction resolvase
MRTGRRVAFDIGKTRIGVAVSDPQGILASPRDYVLRDPELKATVALMLEAIKDEDVLECYIGLPTNLQNERTPSTEDALAVAWAFQAECDQEVRLIDERMTTRLASSAMSGIGKSTKQQRGSIDSASAAVILESALQYEKVNGALPGVALGDYEDGN